MARSIPANFKQISRARSESWGGMFLNRLAVLFRGPSGEVIVNP
jgi:hypothetical protein